VDDVFTANLEVQREMPEAMRKSAISFENREVVGGEPLAAINRRRLRLPTDPD
jgi:hypothetical protein